MFEEWAPGMEILTIGACWSVVHTTVQGHSRGRAPSYQSDTSMWVCVCVCASVVVVVVVGGVMGQQCQLGSLKIVQSGGLQIARDSRNI